VGKIKEKQRGKRLIRVEKEGCPDRRREDAK